MAVSYPSRPRKSHIPFLRQLAHPRLTPRRLRYVAIFCVVSLLLLPLRQIYFFRTISMPDRPTHVKSLLSRLFKRKKGPPSLIQLSPKKKLPPLSELSVNLWRRADHDCPPEKNPPDPKLYGTASEKCYALGIPENARRNLKPGDPAAFWQMNSRAFCYSPNPICLFGKSLQNLLTFEPRGSGTCSVVSIANSTIFPAAKAGLNESCAAFRHRYTSSMFGNEVFLNYDHWMQRISRNRGKDDHHKPMSWQSNFAILVPKYSWSYNICHYNRIWNYIMYMVKNLHLFVPDADKIKHIDILFRSGYAYNQHWHRGVREATLPILQKETGKTLNIAKIRYDYQRDFQCVRRGIILGREGRVDSFPFFNDTQVWSPEHQLNDTHWPVIPHDALWLRQAVYKSSGLADVGEFSGPGIGAFKRIRVPPRTIALLMRSPRSKRRLTLSGQTWFDNTLQELALKHSMKLIHVRTSAAETLPQQVAVVRDIGVAVGLHGANMVNTMFMAPGGSLFEIFPWRYVRYYYAGGGNSGLRYSFHEPEGGIDRGCKFESPKCFFQYRESLIYLTERDRQKIGDRLDKAIGHVAALHRQFPGGWIDLKRVGNMYHIER